MSKPPERIGRLPKKQQKRPRLIKFLQERPDHSWEVHPIEQGFALVCATWGPGAGV
jgi:hypothetical protein